MSDMIIVRNIKSPIEDVSISDGVVVDNVDYALMVDVALYETKTKKNTGEDFPPQTHYFVPTGRIVMVNKQKYAEPIAGEVEAI